VIYQTITDLYIFAGSHQLCKLCEILSRWWSLRLSWPGRKGKWN